jgi:hypothetical protein
MELRGCEGVALRGAGLPMVIGSTEAGKSIMLSN